MDNCTLDCIEIIGNFSSEATCDFVKQFCVQDTIQVIQSYYCLFNGSFVMLVLVSIAVFSLVYSATNVATEDYLAPCLEGFILKLNMSEALAGITFLALANGAPDIITAILAGTSSSASTALIPFGSLFGAALFSTALILSTVIRFSREGLKLNTRQTLLPLGFYLLGTLYLLVISFTFQQMNLAIAIVFCCLYPVYIILVAFEERRKKRKKNEKKEQLEESVMSESEQENGSQPLEKKINQVYDDIHKEEEIEDQQAQEGKRGFMGKLSHLMRQFWRFVFGCSIPVVIKEEWKAENMVVSLVFSPVVLFLANGVPQVFTKSLIGIPYALLFTMPSFMLLIYSGYSIIKKQKPKGLILFNIYGFVIIVAWIATIVSVLINFIQLLQLLTQINPVFLGLTVFAWSSSMGDYLSITTFAKRGFNSTAISGIFSGQLLNFLMGFGISCVMRSIDGDYPFEIFVLDDNTYQRISDVIVIVVIGLTFAYMVILFVLVAMRRGALQRIHGLFSRYYYISFVLIALFISVLTDFFKEFQCDMSL